MQAGGRGGGGGLGEVPGGESEGKSDKGASGSVAATPQTAVVAGVGGGVLAIDPLQTTNPFRVTEVSVDQVNVVPADTATPLGPDWPQYSGAPTPLPI